MDEKLGISTKEDKRLIVLENETVIKIFGPKRQEVTGDRSSLHDEFHRLYSPPNITGDESCNL
jgi:hypothetical protein